MSSAFRVYTAAGSSAQTTWLHSMKYLEGKNCHQRTINSTKFSQDIFPSFFFFALWCAHTRVKAIYIEFLFNVSQISFNFFVLCYFIPHLKTGYKLYGWIANYMNIRVFHRFWRILILFSSQLVAKMCTLPSRRVISAFFSFCFECWEVGRR